MDLLPLNAGLPNTSTSIHRPATAPTFDRFQAMVEELCSTESEPGKGFSRAQGPSLGASGG
jgi:hypothetical protein